METSTDPIERPGPVDGRSDRPKEVSSLVDWGVSAVLALVGIVLAASGWVVYTRVGRPELRDAVTAENVSIDGLSAGELVDVAVPFFEWVSIGLGVTGAILLVSSAGFALARWRTRKHVATHGGTTGTTWAHSVYGAVAGAVLSFVPFSTALGGAVAGYLRNGSSPSGAKIGALSGLLGSVPMATILGGALVGAVAGANAIGEGATGTLLAGVGLVLMVVLVSINVGLGALGGVLGKRL
jgi:hypothetical protein